MITTIAIILNFICWSTWSYIFFKISKRVEELEDQWNLFSHEFCHPTEEYIKLRKDFSSFQSRVISQDSINEHKLNMLNSRIGELETIALKHKESKLQNKTKKTKKTTLKEDKKYFLTKQQKERLCIMKN